MIQATMATLVLLSMAGFSYADSSSTATTATVNVPSSIGITASNNLNFDSVFPDGMYRSAREGGVTITSISNVPVTVYLRTNTLDSGISYYVYNTNTGQTVYPNEMGDQQVTYTLYQGQSNYFYAYAAAQSWTTSGSHTNFWTWTAVS